MKMSFPFLFDQKLCHGQVACVSIQNVKYSEIPRFSSKRNMFISVWRHSTKVVIIVNIIDSYDNEN